MWSGRNQSRWEIPRLKPLDGKHNHGLWCWNKTTITKWWMRSYKTIEQSKMMFQFLTGRSSTLLSTEIVATLQCLFRTNFTTRSNRTSARVTQILTVWWVSRRPTPRISKSQGSMSQEAPKKLLLKITSLHWTNNSISITKSPQKLKERVLILCRSIARY